jgi:hypothetical protein
MADDQINVRFGGQVDALFSGIDQVKSKIARPSAPTQSLASSLDSSSARQNRLEYSKHGKHIDRERRKVQDGVLL